jgi:hypothetical protein
MLSLLPPELLRLVIESTIPHAFHPDLYTERQTTLHSLSRVSHRFRQIAEPLLAEILRLGTKEELEKIPDWVQRKGWVSRVREVVLWAREDDTTMEKLETFVASCPNMTTLSLEPYGQGGFSAGVLAGMPSKSFPSSIHPKLADSSHSFPQSCAICTSGRMLSQFQPLSFSHPWNTSHLADFRPP